MNKVANGGAFAQYVSVRNSLSARSRSKSRCHSGYNSFAQMYLRATLLKDFPDIHFAADIHHCGLTDGNMFNR
jgi:hypothetical protein